MTKTVKDEKELERLIKQGFINAQKRIGADLETEAKRLAPVDSGLLKSRISHDLIENKKLILGCDVEYASDMEYGTSKYWVGTPEYPRKHDTKQRTGKGSEVGYSPFLRTAIHRLRPKFADIVVEEIKKVLT